MSLLRIDHGAATPTILTDGHVVLALGAGAQALRVRAERLLQHEDADEHSAGTAALWIEDAETLDALAAELRA